jgi:hypothetical protein
VTQEICAFGIVGLAAVAALFHFYKGYVAKPLSKILLKKGRVKLAMKMRAQIEESGCGNCASNSDSGSHSGPSCH